jgi:hypothetical protein
MRTLSAGVIVLALAGCAAKHQASQSFQTPNPMRPVAIGKTTEADAVYNMGPPIKVAVAPNGFKNETFELQSARLHLSAFGSGGVTYIFGADGVLRHIIMESGSDRYLMQERNTDAVLPDELVGPMPKVVDITIKRAG